LVARGRGNSEGDQSNVEALIFARTLGVKPWIPTISGECMGGEKGVTGRIVVWKKKWSFEGVGQGQLGKKATCSPTPKKK